MCGGYGHNHGHDGSGIDFFEVTILDDGSVKVETFGAISETNHLAAERFIQQLAAELGVSPTKIRKSHTHVHQKERIKR